MLFDDYAQEGRLYNSNFTEAASTKGIYAYRGDLILEGDFESPANQRRPPSLVMTQVAAIEKEGKIIGIIGALERLESLSTFLTVYGASLATDAVCLFFVRDVPKNIDLSIDGRTLHLLPNDDTLVWNDALDVLGMEKSELKQLSPADKVEALFDAARGFRAKAGAVDWNGALAARVEKAPVDRVGAI